MYTTRVALPGDAAVIAAIYNQGIEDRIGTFETEPRTVAMVAAWFDGRPSYCRRRARRRSHRLCFVLGVQSACLLRWHC